MELWQILACIIGPIGYSIIALWAGLVLVRMLPTAQLSGREEDLFTYSVACPLGFLWPGLVGIGVLFAAFTAPGLLLRQLDRRRGK